MEKLVQLIEKDFKNKNKANPLFSLRSYAKFLGLSPAIVSRILSRKARITPKIFEIIASKLNLTPIEYEHYLQLSKKAKKDDNIRSMREQELLTLQMEEFNLIADWYHLAILHMSNLDNFVQDPKSIAERLGISDVDIVKEAIERLVNFGLLTVDESGKLCKSNQYYSLLDYNFSSTAMRRRQKQIMQISASKIDLVDISLRDHSSMTLEVDVDLLPEIKHRLKLFRRTLGNYIAKNGNNNTQVYELQIGFFPLTENDK